MNIPRFNISTEDLYGKKIIVFGENIKAGNVMFQLSKQSTAGNFRIHTDLNDVKGPVDYFIFAGRPTNSVQQEFVDRFNTGCRENELKELIKNQDYGDSIGFRLTQPTNKAFWYKI